MASKNEMVEEIIKFLDTYDSVITEVKSISREEFLKWFYAFDTYKGVKKAYDFIFKKFLKTVLTVKQVLTLHPPHAWIGLVAYDRHSPEVILLRDCKHDMWEMWKRRPRPPRKGSE